jgi:sulfur carrier protein
LFPTAVVGNRRRFRGHDHRQSWYVRGRYGANVKIRMNDESVELADNSTLADLCARFQIETGGVVIAVDGEVVPKGEFGDFVLKESTVVEVMVFVGGG